MDILPDDLSHSAVVALLSRHLADMHRQSPPESVHALDVQGLRAPDVSFWVAWESEQPVACGALRALGGGEGELKSMRTDADQRGRGIGARMLEHLLAEARRRDYRRVWLETGGTDEFAAAHRLYLRAGFVDCGPFGSYAANPFSRFMTLAL